MPNVTIKCTDWYDYAPDGSPAASLAHSLNKILPLSAHSATATDEKRHAMASALLEKLARHQLPPGFEIHRPRSGLHASIQCDHTIGEKGECIPDPNSPEVYVTMRYTPSTGPVQLWHFFCQPL